MFAYPNRISHLLTLFFKPLKTISVTQSKQFSKRILVWFEQYGRHNLPWQIEPNAYRVWLSEIMLQQTQVVTVIAYYQRFLVKFPTLQSLAAASLDDVLALWAGLGYYARARNLHKTAQLVCNDWQGDFPNSVEGMQSLPGIGRSTAAAILTFAKQQSHPILDGNVKRVIARHYEVKGWSGNSTTLKELWHLSENLTPDKQTANFNQAMMDMGATVCTRSKPKCLECCINSTCLAYKNESWSQYPSSKPKKKNPLKQAYLVMLKHQDSVYLEKRPASGIWGGLWSLPEFDNQQAAEQWLRVQAKEVDKAQLSVYENELLHKFSHYDFKIHLLVYQTDKLLGQINERQTLMLNAQQLAEVGLPTPINTLLTRYF